MELFSSICFYTYITLIVLADKNGKAMKPLSSLVKINSKILPTIIGNVDILLENRFISTAHEKEVKRNIKDYMTFMIGRALTKNYAVHVTNKKPFDIVFFYNMQAVVEKELGSSWMDLKIEDMDILYPYPYPFEVKFLGQEYVYIEEVT